MLDSIPLFAGLGEVDLQKLSQLAVTRSYAKNTVIMSEGDDSDSLYIILSGKVKVYLSDGDGKEVILNIQGPGEYFGELALLDEAPRSASVMTLDDARLAVITKASFEQYLAGHTELALRIIRDLSRRLRALTDNVKGLALMDVYGRVARTLLDMAKDVDGVKVINQKLTQKEIASMVGASREMVSRILKDLSTGGYITIAKNSITIHEKLPPGW